MRINLLLLVPALPRQVSLCVWLRCSASAAGFSTVLTTPFFWSKVEKNRDVSSPFIPGFIPLIFVQVKKVLAFFCCWIEGIQWCDDAVKNNTAEHFRVGELSVPYKNVWNCGSKDSSAALIFQKGCTERRSAPPTPLPPPLPLNALHLPACFLRLGEMLYLWDAFRSLSRELGNIHPSGTGPLWACGSLAVPPGGSAHDLASLLVEIHRHKDREGEAVHRDLGQLRWERWGCRERDQLRLEPSPWP